MVSTPPSERPMQHNRRTLSCCSDATLRLWSILWFLTRRRFTLCNAFLCCNTTKMCHSLHHNCVELHTTRMITIDFWFLVSSRPSCSLYYLPFESLNQTLFSSEPNEYDDQVTPKQQFSLLSHHWTVKRSSLNNGEWHEDGLMERPVSR